LSNGFYSLGEVSWRDAVFTEHAQAAREVLFMGRMRKLLIARPNVFSAAALQS